jgi:transposase
MSKICLEGKEDKGEREEKVGKEDKEGKEGRVAKEEMTMTICSIDGMIEYIRQSVNKNYLCL